MLSASAAWELLRHHVESHDSLQLVQNFWRTMLGDSRALSSMLVVFTLEQQTLHLGKVDGPI